MPDATHTTLREQVYDAIADSSEDASVAAHPDFVERAADAVLAVFAERERLLRERIQGLPNVAAHTDDLAVDLDDVLAVFDA